MNREYIEDKLDEADIEASKTDIRYTADEVFERVRKSIYKVYSKRNIDELLI